MKARWLSSRFIFLLVVFLFIVWIFIGSYWYICNIKGFCFNFREKQTAFIANTFEISTIKTGENKKEVTCSLFLRENLLFSFENNKNEVKKLQFFLNDHLEKNLSVNGVYDRETEKAVKRFQFKNNLNIPKKLGIVDDYTKEKINEISCRNKAFVLSSK